MSIAWKCKRHGKNCTWNKRKPMALLCGKNGQLKATKSTKKVVKLERSQKKIVKKKFNEQSLSKGIRDTSH